MAPTQQYGKSIGGAARSSRLGLLTALSVAGTLLYVFVLLVPAWRTVSVDRDLIGDFLANHSDSSSSDDEARLWDALERDPLLRGRSANAFRECLTEAAPTWDGNATAGNDERHHRRRRQDAGGASQQSALQRHLLDYLAGANFSSLLPSAMTDGGQGAERGRRPSGAVADRCWFLDLHWSEGTGGLTASHRDLLYCTRALFLLAVALLLSYCVGLTSALFACFAARMAAPCRLLLLAAHCMSLGLLVALAVLQDASARLTGQRLRDLLAAAGFPAGCEAAISASRGACSLVLLCILCALSVMHLPLLLLSGDDGDGEQCRKRIVSAGKDEGDAEADGGEKRRYTAGAAAAAASECDDADDTNPLIM